MIRVKGIFNLLLGFFFIKFVFVFLYFYFETQSLLAKEDTSKYNCPPEISDFLNLEKERLLSKERELQSKDRELKLIEQRLQEQMNALKELSADVEDKLNKISAIQDERIKLLAKVYAEMTPSKAAQQLINMDKETAVKILGQLKSNQVASILASMPPDKAAILAEALSGAPPKEY